MANLLGGDLAQMQQLESQLTTASTRVVELQQQVDRSLQHTAWTGPAAERFREDWTGRFSTALRQLHDALRDNAHVVAQRRQAIEAATH